MPLQRLEAGTIQLGDDSLRLESLVGYERVKAPFAGVVTARNIDNGSYITTTGSAGAPNAAGATGGVTELFHVARTDTMRAYVGVPQAYAPSVHPGLEAVLEYTRTKSVWIRTSDEPIADPFVMR